MSTSPSDHTAAAWLCLAEAWPAAGELLGSSKAVAAVCVVPGEEEEAGVEEYNLVELHTAAQEGLVEVVEVGDLAEQRAAGLAQLVVRAAGLVVEGKAAVMSVLVPQHIVETEVAPVQSAGVLEVEVVAEGLPSELHITETWGREDFAARSAEEGAEGFEGENKMAELGLERHSATNRKVAEEGAEV